MAFAQLSACRVHYEAHGADGSPVLLVMGLYARGRLWRNQVPALARRHRVVTFDNRHVGETSATLGMHALRAYAQDALELLDHLGWADAHLVGVSMGGMIAQELALRARGRLRSLTLIATHAGGLRAFFPTGAGMRGFADAQLRGGDARTSALARLLYTEEWLATCDRQAVRDTLREDFGPLPPLRRVAQLQAVLRHGTARRLPKLAGLPTLIVQAGRDLLVRPEESDRLHRLIPGSQLLRFDDAGHGVIRSHAAALNDALLGHFAAADARDRAV